MRAFRYQEARITFRHQIKNENDLSPMTVFVAVGCPGGPLRPCRCAQQVRLTAAGKDIP